MEKIWFFPLVWDYDRCVREAFDIGEDGTRKHRDCTICHRFHGSLGSFPVLANSVLQNCGWYWQDVKPVFKTVFYCFVISAALFAFDRFSAQFWHDEMSCSHRTHAWLNVKHHPPMVDQISHLSHLYVVCSTGYCLASICRIANLQALHRLRLSRVFLWLLHATSTSNKVSFKSISNVHHRLLDI